MPISNNLLNKLILAAIIFRLFLAAFLYHPDLKSQYFHGQFLSQGTLNIYDFLQKNRFNLGYSDTFNYPPLAYLFFGSHYAFSHFIFGDDLSNWLNDWSADHLYRPKIFLILLTLKLPYLFFDLLTLYLLIKFQISNFKLVIVMWLYNPVSLYAIYTTGQFDIIPVFFTVLSLFLFQKQKYSLSALSLGAGVLLKTYPLLLLPALLISTPGKYEKLNILIISLGFGILGLWLSPQSNLTMKILQLGIPVSGSQAVLFFPFAYFLSLWYLYQNPQKIIWFYFVVTASVITFSQFHFQWVLWSMPFLTILVSRSRQLLISSLLFVALAFLHQFLLNDQYSLIALFSPINPYLTTVPSIPNLLKIKLDLVNTFISTGIFASGLYLIYQTYHVKD